MLSERQIRHRYRKLVEKTYLDLKPGLKRITKYPLVLLLANWQILMISCPDCNELLEVTDLLHSCPNWLPEVNKKAKEWFGS